MTDRDDPALNGYLHASSSWADDRSQALAASRKVAWIVAGVAAAIALLEAVALILLTPLKTVVPYTLLVDRQTGYVEAIKPLERATISPDTALVRSFLVQYVIAREGFDIDQLNDNYRKVALWSTGDARSRYLAEMPASNPLSPLATLPRRALVQVQIRSVSALKDNSSLVRYTTTRSDPGGQAQAPQHWAAVITYAFSAAPMRAEDRMINPLGFQVSRYRRDAETLPETGPAATGPGLSGAYSGPVQPLAVPQGPAGGL
jgi:type IV secretion system protein VirB8